MVLLADAVKRSKDGVSTIIDIGLLPSNLTPTFLRSCNEEKVSPHLFTALIYSSLSTITERIKARNEAAQKEGGDVSNSRTNPSNSICGMSQIFMTPEKFFLPEITTEPKIVGQISYEEIVESVRELRLTSDVYQIKIILTPFYFVFLVKINIFQSLSG